jgi:nucleoside 2-deoxyribosyltransferase
MLIVGGTYAERCNTPTWSTTQGSGMRAAGALAPHGARLMTAVDEELAGDAELVANAIKIDRVVVGRSGPVGFDYFTPLSTPRVAGAKTTASSTIGGSDDIALVFGMLETTDVDIECRRLVYDPQRPGSGRRLDLIGLSSEETCVVLNAGEVRTFGRSPDLSAAVSTVFADSGASVVVVKSGATGCVVFEQGGPAGGIAVGACPTPTVWPLGSGDTFAAGFAHAWGAGADAVESARVGSASAAYWCSTKSPTLPAWVLGGDATAAAASGLVPLSPVSRLEGPPKVYLAGPFFNLGELWLVDLVRQAFLAQGVAVFSPLHDVGLGDESVALKDIDGLRECSSVLALLDGSDFGTVFETGWAERAGIPVVGYASRPDKEGAKMLTGLGGELHTDLSTAVYRASWRALGAPALVTAPTHAGTP